MYMAHLFQSSPILASAMEDTTKSDEVHDSCNEGADDKQVKLK